MNTILKMNQNRQINLPVAFIKLLSLGDGRYFKAEVKGNCIILTPVDTVERVFAKEDLDLVEKAYQEEKTSARPVTSKWIKKAHS